ELTVAKQSLMDQFEDVGSADPAFISALQDLEVRIKKAEQAVTKTDEILSDPSRIPESLFTEAALQTDARILRLRENAKQRRM
ncbi:hypothetical protein ACI3PL_28255, partial [Lacticaseibacillus paracasei]